jgi:hypothetical protein
LKNTAEGEEKSVNTIKQFTKEIAEVCNKLKVKEITKMTSHFSIHSMEAEQLPNTVGVILFRSKLLNRKCITGLMS